MLTCPQLLHMCFFFQVSPIHQDLHSFPTRRSSDLGKISMTRSGKATNVNATYSELPSAWFEPTMHSAYLHIFSKVLAAQDRKSTRLNSSHPSISYAVFCLKKKRAIN